MLRLIYRAILSCPSTFAHSDLYISTRIDYFRLEKKMYSWWIPNFSVFRVFGIKRSDYPLFFFHGQFGRCCSPRRKREKNLGKFLKTDAISSRGITGRGLSLSLSLFLPKLAQTLKFFVASSKVTRLTYISLVPTFRLSTILQLYPVFYFYAIRLLHKTRYAERILNEQAN